jgi:hypothetical protein
LYAKRSKWKAMLAGNDGRDAEEFVIHEVIQVAQRELGCGWSTSRPRRGDSAAYQPRGVLRGVRAIAAVD